MADPKIEDRSGEMEHDLHKLEDHIADAEKQLEGRKEAAGNAEAVTGDWEGEQDRGGGDDPEGAKDDAEQAAPGGSQDGPGAKAADGSSSGEDDERVDEEMANPT